MAYQATVLRVALASPGDVSAERQVAREVLHEWNDVHSLKEQAVLLPVGWETHAAPDLAGRAQSLINDRVLVGCDLLIGIFWTRLGTPTGDSASGTAEEIQRHVAAGKPAMVYFSSKPVAPEALNHEQYTALTKFRSWCKDQGLIETFVELNEFRANLSRQLLIHLATHPYLISLLGAPEAIVIDSPPELSEAATTLLTEASEDSDGSILTIASLDGRYYLTNKKGLGLSSNPRDFARFEEGLGQLLDAGLVKPRGAGHKAFGITEAGHRLAEEMKSSSKH